MNDKMNKTMVKGEVKFDIYTLILNNEFIKISM